MQASASLMWTAKALFTNEGRDGGDDDGGGGGGDGGGEGGGWVGGGSIGPHL